MRTSTTDALTIHRQGLVDTAPSVDAGAPVREYAVGRGRTMRTMVAPAMALRELAKRHERGLSYAAMQTSWTEWANRELGDGRVRFQRGRPKAETRAEHLSPEDYRRSLDIAAERDRPWRDLVNRIADTFGDGDQRSRQYNMVKWLHRRRADVCGEPCDPDTGSSPISTVSPTANSPQMRRKRTRQRSRSNWRRNGSDRPCGRRQAAETDRATLTVYDGPRC